jgi:hypothetical protein
MRVVAKLLPHKCSLDTVTSAIVTISLNITFPTLVFGYVWQQILEMECFCMPHLRDESVVRDELGTSAS